MQLKEPENRGVDITLEREGDVWRLSYLLSDPASLLVFPHRTAVSRAENWKPVNDGVRIKNSDGADAVFSDVPRSHYSFLLKFQHGTQEGLRSYAPYIRFQDGTQAIFTGQFRVMPALSPQPVSELSESFRNLSVSKITSTIRVNADAPLLFRGKLEPDGLIEHNLGRGRYIVTGRDYIPMADQFSVIADNELPDWFQAFLTENLSDIFDAISELWGVPLKDRAMMIMAYGGDDRSGLHVEGGALGADEVIMEFSGSALQAAGADVQEYSVWLIAHEIDHLFQWQNNVRVRNSQDSWIIEGSASVTGAKIVSVLKAKNFFHEVMPEWEEGCRFSLETHNVTQGSKSGNYSSLYHCGGLLMLSIERQLPEKTVQALLKESVGSTGLKTDALLTLFEQRTTDPETTADIRTMLYGEREGRLSAFEGLMLSLEQ